MERPYLGSSGFICGCSVARLKLVAGDSQAAGMPTIELSSVLLVTMAAVIGGGAVWMATGRLRRGRRAEATLVVHSIAERIRAVGKLVALEVCAKEIATVSSGWAWLPPLLLSQARLAMIFNFEKQYFVDLSAVKPEHVTPLGPGKFRVRLPALHGQLRLLDVNPYDIQNARVLGLLDVIPMTADRQREMMKRAQEQASELFRTNDDRYLGEARLSVERHLAALMDLFGVEVEVNWGEAPAPERAVVRAPEALPQAVPSPMVMGGRMARVLAAAVN
jgi:hypothetical protein